MHNNSPAQVLIRTRAGLLLCVRLATAHNFSVTDAKSL